MIVDPRSEQAQIFRQAAPPLPPTEDQFSRIQNGVPVVGGALAAVMRALDTYAKLVPRRLIGTALSNLNDPNNFNSQFLNSQPGIGLLRSATAMSTPQDIQQQIGAEQDPVKRFDLASQNSSIPFYGPIAETVFDPLLGVAGLGEKGLALGARTLLSKAGAPITAAARGTMDIGGVAGFSAEQARNLRSTELGQLGQTMKIRGGNAKARGTLIGMMNEAKARQFPAAEPFQTQIFTANPNEDFIAQGWRNSAMLADKMLGGKPGTWMKGAQDWLTAPGRPLALSDRQITTDTLSSYGNLFGYLAQRSNRPLFEFWQDAKDLTAPELKQKLLDMGVPDRLAELARTDRDTLAGAFNQAAATKSKFLAMARDVAVDYRAKIGDPIDLPMAGGKGVDMAQRTLNEDTIRKGLQSMNIERIGDVVRLAEETYGPNASATLKIKTAVKSLSNTAAADPLLANNDVDLVLGTALARRERMALQADKMPAGLRAVGDFYRHANQLEREQATGSIPYFVNNRASSLLGEILFGMKPQEALQSTLEGMQKAFSYAKGDIRGNAPEEQMRALLPQGAVALADRLEMPVYREIMPHRFIDMGDLSDAANVLSSSGKTVMQRMGPAFPALYAGMGALAGGPVGLAVGGITGAAVQKLAPVIYKLEGIADLFGRSEIWYREVGRHVNSELLPFLDRMEGQITASSNWKDIVARARNAPTPEQIRTLHETLMATNGIMGPSYVETALRAHIPGINDSVVNAIKRDWANVVDNAGQSGVDAARKVMLIPRMRNLDDRLKMVLLFHTWATRYIPWIATEMASHPAMTATVLRVMANAEQENQLRGLPDKYANTAGIIHPNTAVLGGLVHALYGNGSIYWNPLMAVNPFQGISGSQQADENSDPLAQVLQFGTDMGLSPNFIVKWLATVHGNLGDQAPSPEFFRHGQLTRDLPLGLATDINQPIRGMTDALRRAFGQNPADLRDYAVRKRVRELATNMGMDPLSPQVRAIEAQPNHPLYQQAAEDMRKLGLAQAGTSLFAPMPGSFKFLGADEAVNRQARADVVRDTGVRSDVAKGLFGANLDTVSPNARAYSRMSFPPQAAPSIHQLISGSLGPRQNNPQQIIQDYLTWAQSMGVQPAQVWDESIVQTYLNTRSQNAALSAKLSQTR